MIDGERRGPFPLERLPDEGVHPSTYVWCKGMADWEKAEDVAEICRFYRGRLYDIMHPAPAAPPQERAEAPNANMGGDTMHRLGGRHGIELPSIEELESREDISVQPRSMLIPAIIATVFFCPPIGIFAIYFALAGKRCWKHSLLNKDNVNDGEVPFKINGKAPTTDDWRRLAHDYTRAAKMWSGIAFFVGIILYSFLIFRL